MRLQNHAAQPRQYHLYGTGPYHLGIELEVEAKDPQSMREGLELEGPKCRIALAKNDGSLGNYGWELVTHPFGRDAWLSPDSCPQLLRIKQLVKSLKDMGYSSHDNGRCGLHIHVSEKAFRGGIGKREQGGTRSRWGSRWDTKFRRSTHCYWFWRIINGQLFQKLSQRESFTYCKPSTKKRPSEANGSGSRYVACNFTERTVEVRIFRGNLRWDRIQKALQAVIAAVEFSRECSSRIWDENLDVLFMRWVFVRREVYPQLYAYLLEKGLWRNGTPAVVSETVEV